MQYYITMELSDVCGSNYSGKNKNVYFDVMIKSRLSDSD